MLWNLDGRARRSIDSRPHGRHDRAIAARTIRAFIAAVRRDSPAGSTASLHSPSASASRPPTGDGNVVLFDGRLDDRETLLASMARGRDLADAPDSTLVLAAWREWGEDFLGRLQGEFALALFDAACGRLIVARDPVGCRPLYYWTNGLTFVFGSEIKAVLAHPEVPAKPNEDLLADYFLLERLPYDGRRRDIFRGHPRRAAGIFIERFAWPHHSAQFWEFQPADTDSLPHSW